MSHTAGTHCQTPLLEVRGLTVRFRRRRGWRAGGGELTAVRDVDLAVRAGEVYGLAGESGSGKSTLARTILGLLRPDAGRVLLDGADLAAMNATALREARRRIQIVFQDPAAALSPRRSIEQSLLEPLDHFGIGTPAERRSAAAQALNSVGLDATALPRFPHQFSSGQRQRVALARALLPDPDILIADEALSALDVSVQAQMLDLLLEVRDQRNIGVLFISHDLAVIRQLSDTVGVMYRGRLVETAPAGELFRAPLHPFTRQLLAAVPHPDPNRPLEAPGIAAGLARAEGGRGCVFAERCPDALDVCRERAPTGGGISARSRHRVECHLAEISDDRTNGQEHAPRDEDPAPY